MNIAVNDTTECKGFVYYFVIVRRGGSYTDNFAVANLFHFLYGVVHCESRNVVSSHSVGELLLVYKCS